MLGKKKILIKTNLFKKTSFIFLLFFSLIFIFQVSLKAEALSYHDSAQAPNHRLNSYVQNFEDHYFLGGGWASSGGELFKFAHNPWFVKNVKEVSYCVILDEATVSASFDTIKDLIAESIQYWKNQFKDHNESIFPGLLKLGDQKYIFSDKCDGVDIEFKFGYGTLDDEEKKELKNPKKFVGVSLRKAYDLKSMKGSGAIFISSDIGENSYENPGNLIEKAWQHKKLLKYALIHEIGHVMGVPHIGSSIMSQVFFDQLLNVNFHKFFIINDIISFISLPKTVKICPNDGSVDGLFFGAPKNVSCYILEETKSKRLSWNISATLKGQKDSMVLLGTIGTSSATNLKQSSSPVAIVQLPIVQEVFDFSDKALNAPFLLGPTFTKNGYRGFFKSVKNPVPKHLYIETSQAGIVMVSNKSRYIGTILTYNQPNVLNSLFHPQWTK